MQENKRVIWTDFLTKTDMGKLKDLWAELKDCKDEIRKSDIQKKINSIEKWMIDNNIGSIKEITDWTKQKTSVAHQKKWRFDSDRMGNHGVPEFAYTGRDRCGTCRWNRHTWCDKGKTKPCVANV